ncbi:hypothetical protein LCG56_27365 (plasmid) [Pseudomonas cannabina pv. alisalensis]|uniref:Uncharacterized protein n=1 Tax=Pseudomonas syringae pv. maculicola str. ES4326 TaxID=629265 RepID=A0A8T8CB19_PSEYM|nr:MULTISPECIES: hypothetical protein [Pseudomonas syringae group]QHF00507.1 hypothetical protein PMA4326_028745 [Pseudomonas syringae pv. maculicola str. ES4326]UBZ00485.1 hypothetical protein LCG56_27365 [Pseudomonas cannabina pv. alisalensis]
MTAHKFAPSKIRWYRIETCGYPPRELRTTEVGHDRVFMVMTDEGLKASPMFDDGSGFADLGDGTPISWAFE